MLSGKKRIPVGYENFKEIIDKNFYYVDKTMLIYDLLDKGGKVNLLTRPRRFGKTLNFSMLKYFFDINEKESAYIFDGLKISEHYDELNEYRNAYPVISLSMKGGKQRDFETSLNFLCNEIRRLFSDFDYILKSDSVKKSDKEEYEEIIRTTSDTKLYGQSLKLLCKCLKAYYGVNAVILIDEYDVPLEASYFGGFYDEMVGFIRSLFESALKTNDALEFAVITGCLRISNESIFTGLNNLRVNSITSRSYSEYFGFVQAEVDEMLEYYGLSSKREEMQRWYDGYLFGNTEVYNPWSVVNQVLDWRDDPDEDPQPWWINTSSNSIINSLIESADKQTRNIIERLINGGSVESPITETVTYGDLDNSSESMWSFMYFTGYLKIKAASGYGEDKVYSLVIPNTEVKACYRTVVRQKFNKLKSQIDPDELYKALLSCDAEGFANKITSLLESSISFYDSTEAFYHGLISGLLANTIYYHLESNRETGTGRCDLILYEEARYNNAIIMEFKVCRAGERIDLCAERALKQINDRGYAAEARRRGYTNIIKYGIAFDKKICHAVAE